MKARLLALLAAAGNIIGLRSTESDVTLTVEGRWSGRFDPVRLGLTVLLVATVTAASLCTVFTWGDGQDFMRQGPYQTP